VTGVEHLAPRLNRTADRFRVAGGRTVLAAGGFAVRGRGCLRTGSGVPAAGPSIILSRIGEVRLGAGVIHSQPVPSPSGSGFAPPYETSYRGLKLRRISAALEALVSCGVRPICRRWTRSRGLAAGDQAPGLRAHYRCSLGTNTVLGNWTNRLFGVLLLVDGPEN
jgi:hypothetical protein